MKHCDHCGTPFTTKPGGHRRRFCSPRCRQLESYLQFYERTGIKYHNRNRDPMQGPEPLCEQCKAKPAKRLSARFARFCGRPCQQINWKNRYEAEHGVKYVTEYFRKAKAAGGVANA